MMHRYRPEIEGLRALAIVPILLFHFGLGFPGGYTGVDVFFVISGYLITAIILNDLASDSFRFTDFCLRRARRLFPALGFVLAATLIAGWFWLLPQEYKSLSGQVIAVLAFVANVKFYTQSGYWSPAAEEIPLLHTWALAVEEQFYLIMPLVLMLIWRIAAKRVSVHLFVLAGISLAGSIIATPTAPDFAFYLLPTRAWEFLVGGIIASYGARLDIPNRRIAGAAGWIGIILILIPYFTFNAMTPFPGWRALLPCLGAGLFLISNQAGLNGAGKLLSLSPLVFVGKVSYSLYLWHWPVFVFIKYRSLNESLSAEEQGFGILLSIILAIGSWKYIEKPFRFGKKGSPSAVGFAIPAMFVILAISSVSVRLLNGAKNRPIFPEEMAPMLSQENPARLHFDVRGKWPQGGKLINADLDSQPPQLVVIGSSHAVMYGPLIQSLALEYRIPTSFLTAGGIYGRFDIEEIDFPFTRPQTPNREDKLKTDRIRLELLRKWRPELVLWIDRWDTHLSRFSEAELRRTLEHSLGMLKETSGKVVLFGQPPKLESRNEVALVSGVWKRYLHAGNLSFLDSQKEVPTNRREVERILADVCADKGVRFVKVDELFLKEGHVILTSESGSLLYWDDDHLSMEGTRMLEGILRDILKDISAIE